MGSTGALSPRLRGEGWGEGLGGLAAAASRLAPHPDLLPAGGEKGSRLRRRETFGFPQVSAGEHRGSAKTGFSAFGFPWNSLDFLDRNEPFQWVTGEPGRFFFARPFPARTGLPGPISSFQESTRPTRCARQTLRRRETAERRRGSRRATSKGPIGALGSEYDGFPFFARNCHMTFRFFLSQPASPRAKASDSGKPSGPVAGIRSGRHVGTRARCHWASVERSGRQEGKWLRQIESW